MEKIRKALEDSQHQAAETSRKLLLEFDHVNIALCLIVIKRHLKVIDKSQNLDLSYV